MRPLTPRLRLRHNLREVLGGRLRRIPWGGFRCANARRLSPPELLSRPAAARYRNSIFGGIPASLNGVQEVAGSNPVAPTRFLSRGPKLRTATSASKRAEARSFVVGLDSRAQACRGGPLNSIRSRNSRNWQCRRFNWPQAVTIDILRGK